MIDGSTARWSPGRRDRAPRPALALLLSLLLAAAGCSTTAAPAVPDALAGADSGIDASVGDGGREASPDLRLEARSDALHCSAPFIADCLPPCPADEICSEAQGGRCASLLPLTGDPASAQALAAVVKAMVGCWTGNKDADRNVLCAAFDTCTLTGPISEAMVKSWVCSSSEAQTLLGQQTYDEARSLHVCSGIGIYRPDWKVSEIGSAERGIFCISRHRYPLLLQADRLEIERCKYFRPFDS